MSSKKITYSDNNVMIDEVLNRLKQLRGVLKQKEVAALLGISSPDLANRTKRNTLLPLILMCGIREKINLNWLLSGDGEPYIKDTYQEKDNSDERRQDFKISDLVTKTIKVLESNTEYAESLSANIKSFHSSIKMQNRLSAVESEINGLKSHILNDRRKQERRNQVKKVLLLEKGKDRRRGGDRRNNDIVK